MPHAYLCEDPEVIGIVLSDEPCRAARTDPSMPDLAPAARDLVHSYIDTLAAASVDHVAVGLGGRPARQLLCAAGVALVAASRTKPSCWCTSSSRGSKARFQQTRTVFTATTAFTICCVTHRASARVGLDWELSTIGDPLAASRTLTVVAPGRRSLGGRDLAALGIPEYGALRVATSAPAATASEQSFYRAFRVSRRDSAGHHRRALDGTNASALAPVQALKRARRCDPRSGIRSTRVKCDGLGPTFHVLLAVYACRSCAAPLDCPG